MAFGSSAAAGVPGTANLRHSEQAWDPDEGSTTEEDDSDEIWDCSDDSSESEADAADWEGSVNSDEEMDALSDSSEEEWRRTQAWRLLLVIEAYVHIDSLDLAKRRPMPFERDRFNSAVRALENARLSPAIFLRWWNDVIRFNEALESGAEWASEARVEARKQREDAVSLWIDRCA